MRKSTGSRGRDRRGPRQRPSPEEPPWAGGSVCVPSLSERLGFTLEATRPVQRSNGLLSADLTSEAAATLRCVRRGGPAPNAAAAVTRDRRDRERPAVAEGCGAVSMRWAVGADCCGAMGCRESDGLVRVEDGGDRRVLCLWHARRWVR